MEQSEERDKHKHFSITKHMGPEQSQCSLSHAYSSKLGT
jgi:hypothetical protein